MMSQWAMGLRTQTGHAGFSSCHFVSKIVAQRDIILEGVWSELPFPLTWAEPTLTESLVGTLLLALVIPMYFKAQMPLLQSLSRQAFSVNLSIRPKGRVARLDL